VADVSTHELSVRDGVVVKRFRSWARGEPAREWMILRLLDERAPGLGPAPVRADLDGDPPSVTMSLVPGVPLAAAPTPPQHDALAAALCRLWTVPVAGLPPRRYLPDEVASTLMRDLAGRRFGGSTVDTAVAAALEFLATPWVEAPDPVLGHSDPNVANYLWDGDRVRIVDFEDAGRSDRAYELATLVEHLAARGGDWEPFLDRFDVDRDRLLAGRCTAAALWLHTLLTVEPARRRNPPGTARRQAEHLLSLLRRR
jgi:hypothetical protein